MRTEAWRQPQRQMLLAVAIVAVISAGTLGWLGWLLVQQDAALERQGQADRLQQAATAAASAVRLALADLPTKAAQRPGGEPRDQGWLRFELQPSALVLPADARVLFLPDEALPPDEGSAEVEAAEAQEYGGDLEAALRAYRGLASVGPDARRAAALSRAARVQRKRGEITRALQTYVALLAHGSRRVDGLPAALVARVGRASVFESAGDRPGLRAEATMLRHALLAGTWPLSAAQFAYYAGEAARWTEAPVRPRRQDLSRTDALAWAWTHVRTASAPGYRLLRTSAGPAVVAWSPVENHVRVIGGDASAVAAVARRAAGTFTWALRDGAGATLAGEPTVTGASAPLVADADGGNWTLHVETIGGPRGVSPRRPLLLLTVLVAAAVLLAGWYFILRAMARERAAVGLQSDFVAAVSHEFRSPLTSITHIADMLASGRLGEDEAKGRAYALLQRDADRLRALVEQLLEFGRFEAGGPVLRFEPVDVAALVQTTTAEFAARVAADGISVAYDGPDTSPPVSADRDALSMALWNLLDNASKYSPGRGTVSVRLRAEQGAVAVDVRDQGLGIPLHEQVDIFRQFVRGAEPKARRIKGTGIGLALVRHIARAHGGDVSVVSEPGQGSTFTLRLCSTSALCNATPRPGVARPTAGG